MTKSNLPVILGLLGCALLVMGVFSPILSVPIMGDVNYFQNGKGDGSIVLILVIVSICFILLEKCAWLWWTSIPCLGVLTFTFVMFQQRMAELKAEINSELQGNIFKGLTDMMVDSVQIQWGFPVLVIGGFLLLASAYTASGEKETTEPASK